MFIKKLAALFAAAMMITGAAGSLPEVAEPITAQAITESDQLHSELLEKCRGHYAYDHIGSFENGKKMQEFYNMVYDACCDVWSSESDVEKKTTKVKDGNTGEVTNMDFYSIGTLEYPITDDFDREDAISSMLAVRYDNPLFYFLDNNWITSITQKYAGPKQGYKSYVKLEARVYEDYVGASVRKELQQDIYDYITDMTSALGSRTRRFDKALILHDKILPMMTYNYDDMSAVYSHNIIGAVENKTGVCESYAKTYQMLLNYVGVDNMLVVGKEKESGGGHAWNAVKMDNGTYYFVDVTWDDKRDTHAFFAKGHTVFDEKHVISASTDEHDEYSYSSSPQRSYFYSMPSGIPDGDYSCQANDPTLYDQMSKFSFYINDDNTVTIVKYLGSAQKVVIPDSILGLPVSAVELDAFFASSSLNEVVLPDTLKTLGKGAFFHTLLNTREITIPKSVTFMDEYSVGWCASVGGSGYQHTGDYSMFSPKKITNFNIRCYNGSAAHKYALKYGFLYELLDAPFVPGDADGDGVVGIGDVVIMKQYLAGWKVTIDLEAADVDGDGQFGIQDVVRMRQYLAGWKVRLGAA